MRVYTNESDTRMDFCTDDDNSLDQTVSELINIRILLQPILTDANFLPDAIVIQKVREKSNDDKNLCFPKNKNYLDDIFNNLCLMMNKLSDPLSKGTKEKSESLGTIEEFISFNDGLNSTTERVIQDACDEISNLFSEVKNSNESAKFKLLSPVIKLKEEIKFIDKYIQEHRILPQNIDKYMNVDMDSEEISQYFLNTFDDTKFFHSLLKESSDHIRKSKDMNLLEDLSNSAVGQFQKSKSKDRKLKYIPHQKLIGFMAPHPCVNIEDNARLSIIASLFKNDAM